MGRAAVLAVLTAAALVGGAEAARVLMLAPYGTKSHMNFYMGVAEALAENHTVTFLTGVKLTSTSPNIHVVHVEVPDVLSMFHGNPFKGNSHQSIMNILPIWHTFCSDALAANKSQQVLEDRYDLAIIGTISCECFLPHLHQRQIPVVQMFPNQLTGAMSALAHNIHFPSFIPNLMLQEDNPSSLKARVINALTDAGYLAMYFWYMLPRTETECRSRGLCPAEGPSLGQLVYNNSLTIINSIRSLESPPRPHVPTVVHAGGIHCRPARPLPQDLEQWVTEAGEDGVILFSLGSAVQPSLMPEEYKATLVQVFASLKQRVLWKWDEDHIDGLSSNVRLSKWLPQQDLLGHPQMRLFLTHGGLLSAQEAMYHGVPLVGIPVHLDQHENLRHVKIEGWGGMLLWKDLNVTSLRSLILEALEDTRMREVVQQRRRLMRDQPVGPREWSRYWVEYVIRHSGAYHLRCPASSMPWYRLYNVDVWLTIVTATLTVLTLTLFLSYKCLRCALACCCRSSQPKNKRD